MSRLLIVEDEVSIALMYQFKLEQKGYEVSCAYNGAEGLKQAEKLKPDLILLDIRMPEMTGDDMLERVRSTKWGSTIRVIILTNISRDEAPQKLRLLNIDRYIVKAHYTPSQVASVVDEVLRANLEVK